MDHKRKKTFKHIWQSEQGLVTSSKPPLFFIKIFITEKKFENKNELRFFEDS